MFYVIYTANIGLSKALYNKLKTVNLVILFNICIYTNPLKSVRKSGDFS